jgi:hypothetical protein
MHLWYPGKLNTLTFKAKYGVLAKDCLIKLCEHYSLGET